MTITIVGGGISGLSAGYLLKISNPTIEITILEASERLGGKIWTDKRDGFLCEAAVNGFLDNKPKTLEFINFLGLEILRSNDAARRRFIYLNGKLHLIPESPQSFLSSGLLSPCGKVRLLAEILIPKSHKEDETLAEFASRRLGREAYEKLIEPMAIGIYAGNAEELSIRSCFPRIYQLEKEYGSLFRALFRIQRHAKKTGRAVGPAPAGVLSSFKSGMHTIVDVISKALKETIKTGKKATALEPLPTGGYRVFTSDGDAIESDAILLACPAYEASKLLSDLIPELAEKLKAIIYPPVTVVCLGYEKSSIPGTLDGFGFLVPSRERRNILGVLMDSNIFENRAPEGHALLRVMVGGARNPSVAMKNDEDLLRLVFDELLKTSGLKAEPVMTAIYRHEKSIPQYMIGHWKIRQQADDVSNQMKGLYLTGNAYRGIGFNDCIESAYLICERIVTDFGLTPLGGKN